MVSEAIKAGSVVKLLLAITLYTSMLEEGTVLIPSSLTFEKFTQAKHFIIDSKKKLESCNVIFFCVYNLAANSINTGLFEILHGSKRVTIQS
jgi:hypothetical protein